MTLPFEQDQWLTLIKLNGEGFTDYYLNIYGKDKINSGSKVLVHTSENHELCNSDEFDIEHKITVDSLFYTESAKLIANNKPLPTQIEFISELAVKNKLYRDYRDQHTNYKEGYNYHLYSDIHYDNVDLNVTLKSI